MAWEDLSALFGPKKKKVKPKPKPRAKKKVAKKKVAKKKVAKKKVAKKKKKKKKKAPAKRMIPMKKTDRLNNLVFEYQLLRTRQGHWEIYDTYTPGGADRLLKLWKMGLGVDKAPEELGEAVVDKGIAWLQKKIRADRKRDPGCSELCDAGCPVGRSPRRKKRTRRRGLGALPRDVEDQERLMYGRET